MRIIAENRAEDRMLKEIEELLHENGHNNVSCQSFIESFMALNISDSLSDIKAENIKDWEPEQVVWFLNACRKLLKQPSFKNFKKEYEYTIGIYSEVFKSEKEAFKVAVRDYILFLYVKKHLKNLTVDNHENLNDYLKSAVTKCKDQGLKTASTYYDKELSRYVIELNTVKVPYILKDGKIREEAIVYGWSDADFRFKHEFLRVDLVAEIKRTGQIIHSSTEDKNLDNKIIKVNERKTHSSQEEKIPSKQEYVFI